MLKDYWCNAKRPSPHLLFLEPCRTFFEFALGIYSMPFLSGSEDGNNHTVMLISGILTLPSYTKLLRMNLKRDKFRPIYWHNGFLNTSFDKKALDDLCFETEKIYEKVGKFSIVGYSLGGLYARQCAKKLPDCFQQVITIGTPLSTETNFTELYQKITDFYKTFNLGNVVEVSLDLQPEMQEPPPVPTSIIYSKSEGVVHPSEAVGRKNKSVNYIEVSGSHCGMVFHPNTYRAIRSSLLKGLENNK